MSSLANLTYDDNIQGEVDSLGGSFTLFPSGIHDAEIKMAYLSKASSGALGLVLIAGINGKEYRETLWMTNKEGKNFYVGKNDGAKKYLAGFIHADAIACLAAKCPLSDLDTETKMVKIYNKDAGSEVPTKVEVITALLGKPIKLGLIQQKVFKQERVNDKYVDTAETREETVIDKIFRASDSKTTAEIRAKAETAGFAAIWAEKWTGNVKDRTKGKTPKTATGTAGVPVGRPSSSSLFGDD